MTLEKPEAPSVLIAGLAKTGTTGVYDTVRSAVSGTGDYAFLFEPKSPEPFLGLGRYAPYRPIVTKIMVHHLDWCAPRYGDFDRRLMTVRDPRDTVISRLLFRPMAGMTATRIEVGALDPFVDALKEKEADPGSHSVKALHDLADRLGISDSGWPALLKQMREQTRLIDDENFFVLRYEDFVDGRLDETSDYLGVSLADKQTTDDGWKSHISRSMKHGDWKRWFLDEDIEYFGNLFGGYMQRFGYSDWEREKQPRIDPATSSDYVRGKAVSRITERQSRSREKWTVTSVETREDLRHIESMAEDGRAIWAYRVALVYEQSRVFGPDHGSALRWARHGAVLGNVHAMALVARLLRQRDGDDQNALLEARFWQREHDVLAGQQRTTRVPESGEPPSTEYLNSELERTQKALRNVRSSARYRLGSAIADAVANPRQRAAPAVMEVARLGRRAFNSRRAGSRTR